MWNEEDIKNRQTSKIPFYIIEGKKYLYDGKKVAWAQYVTEIIKEDKCHGNEFEKTIYFMNLLSSGKYSIEEIVKQLNNQYDSVEELYHILKNLLYFHQDGPAVFRRFYKGYINIPLEELIDKIEEENQLYEEEKQMIKK